MEGVIGFTTLFAGNFAPKSWAFCQGQIINISSNTALFSILGTTYGGNGTTTFALPDLQGRTIVGVGTGNGLSTYTLGQKTGVENTALSALQMPAHVHPFATNATLGANSTTANVSNPSTAVYAADSGGGLTYSADGNVPMQPFTAALTMTPVGNSQPFEILRPFLGLNQIICTNGVFPARN